MANTPEGAKKIAAKLIGVSFEEYQAHIEAGDNWCNKCKTWKPNANFVTDRSRWNGLARRCKSCSYTRTAPGPSNPERKVRRARGQAWCSRCEAWLPIAQVHGGLCRPHSNQAARERYASSASTRMERRQHAHARKRNVAPIPVVGQESILEEFDDTCAYCDAPATTWDHIVPISKGGTTAPWNIVPACQTCNSSKKDRDLEEWLEATGRPLKQLVDDRMVLVHLPLAL